MSKIAKVDNYAMNSLYASELAKAGLKTAADDKGIINAPTAFEDHAEYLETLKSIMSEDKGGKFGGAPNDPIAD